MSRLMLNRYIWIVDTIRRHQPISRKALNERWANSEFGNGEPLSRRTFYNYRNGIEELLGIRIGFNPSTYEYYLESDGNATSNGTTLTDWMLNSATMSNVLSDMSTIADKVFLEDVPSARLHLSTVIKGIRDNLTVRFTYHPYTRSLPTPGVKVEPYFLKIFRQRWYLTGLNTSDGKIKTYALDRMSDVTLSTDSFDPPAGFDAAEFVRDAFGIVFTQGPVYRVALKVTPRRAKYIRALPLHHSQLESVHDSFSIFTYNLRLTPDLVQELLSYGSEITVLEPPQLKAMIITSLQESLANYGKGPHSKPNQSETNPEEK